MSGWKLLNEVAWYFQVGRCPLLLLAWSREGRGWVTAEDHITLSRSTNSSLRPLPGPALYRAKDSGDIPLWPKRYNLSVNSDYVTLRVSLRCRWWRKIQWMEGKLWRPGPPIRDLPVTSKLLPCTIPACTTGKSVCVFAYNQERIRTGD